jgi:hypothetical protein
MTKKNLKKSAKNTKGSNNYLIYTYITKKQKNNNDTDFRKSERHNT